jgi:pyridoxal phosphate enzyme (YggS family)
MTETCDDETSNDSTASRLAGNLRRIRDRMGAACARSGRPERDVTLVAVTKYAELDWVRRLVELGVSELGESRPQQLVSRAEQLPAHVHWHLIGHLQRNKVESILPATARIHSVDSVRLAEAINNAARKLELRPRLLLEVNVSGEQSKDGFVPADLLSAWPAILRLEFLSIDGLMTMAPLGDPVEAARPVFRSLRELRDHLVDASGGACHLPDLSMGMSGDFEVAIEEGATLVRIGSGLFEGLVAG